MLSSTQSGGLFLLDLVSAGLGRRIGVAATPDGPPSLISLTLEGPLARIPSSRGTPASLGPPSKTDLSLEARSGESTEIIA